MQPHFAPDQGLSFPEPLRSSWVRLRGRVIWQHASVREHLRDAPLQVRVNGTLWRQQKLRHRPDGGLEEPFEMDVRLATTTSRLSVRLAGAPEEARTAGEFTVSCPAATLRQRLHLLVIGVGATDTQSLRTQALQAFMGHDLDPATGRFETPAYQAGARLYGPLIGRQARRNAVLAWLNEIRKTLIRPDVTYEDAPTEFVFVSYQGEQRLTRTTTVLRLGHDEGEEIGIDEIARAFDGTRGNRDLPGRCREQRRTKQPNPCPAVP